MRQFDIVPCHTRNSLHDDDPAHPAATRLGRAPARPRRGPRHRRAGTPPPGPRAVAITPERHHTRAPSPPPCPCTVATRPHGVAATPERRHARAPSPPPCPCTVATRPHAVAVLPARRRQTPRQPSSLPRRPPPERLCKMKIKPDANRPPRRPVGIQLLVGTSRLSEGCDCDAQLRRRDQWPSTSALVTSWNSSFWNAFTLKSVSSCCRRVIIGPFADCQSSGFCRFLS